VPRHSPGLRANEPVGGTHALLGGDRDWPGGDHSRGGATHPAKHSGHFVLALRCAPRPYRSAQQRLSSSPGAARLPPPTRRLSSSRRSIMSWSRRLLCARAYDVPRATTRGLDGPSDHPRGGGDLVVIVARSWSRLVRSPNRAARCPICTMQWRDREAGPPVRQCTPSHRRQSNPSRGPYDRVNTEYDHLVAPPPHRVASSHHLILQLHSSTRSPRLIVALRRPCGTRSRTPPREIISTHSATVAFRCSLISRRAI
jgi:hypothetical protein